ncbi:sigma-54-dependent Fis family transcriptional regulator, partial [Salmonella enterica subsp. enterica]|nr:sigma-54-dependent Fis family transcriptional regulator [Salmonella enterica subsp. enterica serovar Javiana]
ELENVIHFALLVSSGEEILPQHLNLPASAPLQGLEQQLARLSAAERTALLQRLSA